MPRKNDPIGTATQRITAALSSLSPDARQAVLAAVTATYNPRPARKPRPTKPAPVAQEPGSES